MPRALIWSAILFMVAVAETAATCKTSDLTGRWAYFATDSITDEDGNVLFLLTADCRFTIDTRAHITEVNCGGGGSDFPDDLRGEFLGAEVQMQRNCRFEITGAAFCDYFGQISIDKITGAGVAFCGNSFDRLSFNLVKR